jgi:ParB family chromosome partitioning protein
MSDVSPLKRRALGRGLDALIPGGGSEREDRERERVVPLTTPTTVKKDYFLAPIEELHPSPEQPRQAFDEGGLNELAASIRAQGVITPLIVRERPKTEGGGDWIIAGERRWRASQRAGLKDVPVLLRDSTRAKALEAALIDNIQREDLNPIEEAEGYKRLSDELGYTQEQIAERVGKDRATVANSLRLLKLPGSVRELVQKSALSMGHARALLGLDDTASIERTALKVVARALSVRATEELVRKERGDGAGKPKAPVVEKTAAVKDLEQKLTRALGTRVTVADRGGGKGGSIDIAYSSLDELDRLLDQLLSSTRN